MIIWVLGTGSNYTQIQFRFLMSMFTSVKAMRLIFTLLKKEEDLNIA